MSINTTTSTTANVFHNNTGHASSSLSDWLQLIRSRRWSRRQKYGLLNLLRSPLEVLRLSGCAADKLLTEIGLVDSVKRKKVHQQESRFDIAQDIDLMHREGIKLITILDSAFPPSLKEIYDPPIALFSKGNLTLLQEPMMAIVGSRRPSPVGNSTVYKISEELASMGIVIVSGLALGIDATAHQGALAVDGGTIAVLGSGIDITYPARNSHLFARIEQSGLILSEYPPGFKPTRYSFPDRNRLVSGLSLGVVIAEAAEKSGTLITARLALEQNREVMVMPGPAVSQQYIGSHRLVREGAALVSSATDVLNELYSGLGFHIDRNLSHSSWNCTNVGLNETQLLIFELLDYVPISIDSIVLNSGLPHSMVIETLLELELEGAVASSPEGGYIRRV